MCAHGVKTLGKQYAWGRAAIFRRHQADLGLLFATLGAQQRHYQFRFSFAIPRPRQS